MADPQPSPETRDRAVAEILAILLRLPARHRLGVFAVAIRAALDCGVLDEELEEAWGPTRPVRIVTTDPDNAYRRGFEDGMNDTCQHPELWPSSHFAEYAQQVAAELAEAQAEAEALRKEFVDE